METEKWLEQCQTWTKHDDELWEKGWNSGCAYDKYTGKPLTFTGLKELCKDWDMVRDIMTYEEFYEKRIYSVPFEERK